jgi:hypothetical protein
MGEQAWKSYEKLTKVIFESILAQTQVPNLDVKHNVTLHGKISTHQIDVLWTFELEGVKYSTIVQVKNWKKPVEQLHLFALKQILDDLPGQPKGIFVTRGGYQDGAKTFALANGILIYDFRELEPEPPLQITAGGWGNVALVPAPIKAHITDGAQDDSAKYPIGLNFEWKIFTPHYSSVQCHPVKSWLDHEYPSQDFSDLTRFKAAEPNCHEIQLHDESGVVVGKVGIILGEMTQTVKAEGVEKKRVTHNFTEPVFIRTTSSTVPRMRIASVSADIEIRERRESRRGRMADFPRLVLHQLNTDQRVYFSATPSVISQITRE